MFITAERLVSGDEGAERCDTLVLPYHTRCKSRFRAQLASGDECGVLLPRGTTLRDGDRLMANDGRIIIVRAEAEPVHVAYAEDPLMLIRAAYHLGNRHVPLAIASNRLMWLRDPVLADLALRLGLRVEEAVEPFEPEPGAYGQAHAHPPGHHHEFEGHGPRIHDHAR